jgi:hypothetical protein
MTDDLDAKERELSALELRLDEQSRQAEQVRRDLQRDKAAALRRVDHVAVENLNEQLLKNQAVVDSAREVRQALGTEWQALAQERARRKAAADLEAHGPRPCLALSLPGRLGALGLDGHLVASIVPVVESHQHSVAWAEDPDRFMPGASPQELERVALALSKLISLIHGRDDEAEKALTLAREFARDEAHRRRPAHPWRNHQGVGFP